MSSSNFFKRNPSVSLLSSADGLEMHALQPDVRHIPSINDIDNDESSQSNIFDEEERIKRNNVDTQHTSNIPTTIPTTTIAVDVDEDDSSADDYQNRDSLANNHLSHVLHIKFKWRKLFLSREFLGRIIILIITLVLLSLSSAYCVAQFYYSTLHLVKQCEPQSREDIWKHSYKSGLQNGKIKMNVTSQWGHTNDACWTTKTIDTNTDDLWYSNVYEAHRSSDIMSSIHWKAVLFGLLSIYCVCILLYNLYTLIQDILYVSREKLHTTSIKYKYFMQNQQQKVAPPRVDAWFHRKIRDLFVWWMDYMNNDTIGWIIRGVISEIIELLIQTQALLLYNGCNVFDTNKEENIYLANRPYFIVVFAVIVSFNALGSGVLWLSYALLTKYCHGLLFQLLLFCVDQFADLLYALFPFIIILFDDYNENRKDIYVLLSQLNIESGAFFSAFMPLFLLCSKSLMITRAARRQLANRYYKQWKFVYDVAREKKDEQALYQAQLAGYKVNKDALQNNNKEIYDSKGNILLSMNRVTSKPNWIQNNADHKVSFTKQCILVLIALTYIIYGFGVLYFVINHLHNAKNYCELIRESNFFMDDTPNMTGFALSDNQTALLQSNPELFFWDNCLWKVYPFLGADTESVYHHRCQCRVFVMNWNDTKSTRYQRRIHFNLSQAVILQHMLQHWFMLEKFQTIGTELEYIRTRIISSMFIAKNMKAFEWINVKIDCIQRGISNWKQLEYLKFGDTSLAYEMSNDFGGLTSMKYLSFDNSGLQTFPHSICNLTKLEVLSIFLEVNIVSIPKCISNLQQLKELVIDNCLFLENVPFSVFNLPNMVILSIFHAQISWKTFIEYNAPNDTDTNDTNATIEWIINEFKTSPSIQDIYVSLNPICEALNTSWFPIQLRTAFNDESCSYLCNASESISTQFCPPRLLGNGRCDFICNNGRCDSDHGDCVQLCFAPQLTECNYTLYTNDVCDEACDNDYCTEYYDETFQNKVIYDRFIEGSYAAADLWHCAIKTNITKNTQVNVTNCTESQSNYIGEFPDDTYLTEKCQIEWIGDNLCDDVCRTDECDHDGSDCEPSSACANNHCKFIFDAWQMLVEPFVYNVNISYFCTTLLPIAVQVFGYNPLEFISCMDDSYVYDFNQDQFVNFREFSYLAYRFAGGWKERAKQINCSECIGVEYYNINNKEIFVTSEPIDMCNIDYR